MKIIQMKTIIVKMKGEKMMQKLVEMVEKYSERIINLQEVFANII